MVAQRVENVTANCQRQNTVPRFLREFHTALLAVDVSNVSLVPSALRRRLFALTRHVEVRKWTVVQHPSGQRN